MCPLCGLYMIVYLEFSILLYKHKKHVRLILKRSTQCGHTIIGPHSLNSLGTVQKPIVISILVRMIELRRLMIWYALKASHFRKPLVAVLPH